MSGVGYTLPAVASVAAVVVLEAVLRTGLFGRVRYWLTMLIVTAFQIPVDGWLTRLPTPIVRYDPEQFSGWRFPLDIPVEDFLFGFALVTATLLLWERQRIRKEKGREVMTSQPGGPERDRVLAAFDRGAFTYDRLVGVNPGYHAHLRASAARLRLPGEGEGLRLLDAGCGTGASTAALLSVAPKAEIVAIDASAQMLKAARAKDWPSSVRFVHTRVEDLVDSGVDGPFDGILAAYLIRNLADPDTQLRTLGNLLRPGASLAVHEYSVRDSVLARAVWSAVCWGVIIPAGRVATGDAELYRHLWRSVLAFDGAREFQNRLRRNGLVSIHRKTMTGWQREVVHTFLGTRG